MIGKRNQARRKAESEALFHQMLKAGKHKVITPKPQKETRSEKKRKAIQEGKENE